MTAPPSGPRAPARKQRGALLGVVVLSLLGFAAFFVGFVLAPLAILLIFCLVIASRNRTGGSKKAGPADAPSRGGSGRELGTQAPRGAPWRAVGNPDTSPQPAGLAPASQTSDPGGQEG
jgi:hypothetical protein